MKQFARKYGIVWVFYSLIPMGLVIKTIGLHTTTTVPILEISIALQILSFLLFITYRNQIFFGK